MEHSGVAGDVLGIVIFIVAKFKTIIKVIDFVLVLRKQFDILYFQELLAVDQFAVDLEENVLLVLTQSQMEGLGEQSFESSVFYHSFLAKVIAHLDRLLFQLLVELSPLLPSDLLVNLLVDHLHLVESELVVQAAEVFAEQTRLPALVVSTLSLLDILVLVLPEIEGLSRMNLMTDGVAKVLVAYCSILVLIKHLEDFPELLVRHRDIPVVEVEAQLPVGDAVARDVLVHIFECLQNRLPLELDLVDYLKLKSSSCRWNESSFLHFVKLIKVVHILVVLGILNGVVSEVEALTLVDAVAYPAAEVFVVEFALLLGIPFLNYLAEIVKVEVVHVSKVSKEVCDSDEAIMIPVKREECFPNRVEIVPELVSEAPFYRSDSLKGQLCFSLGHG